MRVLVIGGGGLLGTHLVPHLLAGGHEVGVCDNFTGCPRFVGSLGVRLFTPNVTDFNSMRQTFNLFKPEVVIVSPAHHHSREAVYSFFDDAKLVSDSAHAIAALLTSSVKHVYFCSSSEVYGGPQTNKLLKETRKIRMSASHHGAAKLGAEQSLAFRCKELGIGWTSLRIFEMFGPRKVFCARTGLISFLIDSFLYHPHETVGLVGGTRMKDFIHVEDVATAIIGLMSVEYNGVVNVGSGVGTTLTQVVQGIAKHIDIVFPPMLIPDTNVPSFSAVADVGLLKSLLPSWKVEHKLSTCLEQLVAFRKHSVESVAEDPLAVLNATRGL